MISSQEESVTKNAIIITRKKFAVNSTRNIRASKDISNCTNRFFGLHCKYLGDIELYII